MKIALLKIALAIWQRSLNITNEDLVKIDDEGLPLRSTEKFNDEVKIAEKFRLKVKKLKGEVTRLKVKKLEREGTRLKVKKLEREGTRLKATMIEGEVPD